MMGRLCANVQDSATKNVVSGGMLYPSCANAREDNWAGLFTLLIALLAGKSCGPNARYFQPNDQAL